MDMNSFTKPKNAWIPAVPEKQIKVQDGASKQAMDSHDKCTAGQGPLAQPQDPLEKKIEGEKRRRQAMINEHNRITHAVNQKEAKLKELRQTLKALNFQLTNYDGEDALKQCIRQLENKQAKMKMKIKAAKDIQTAYYHIHEKLQQEVRDMSQVLDQKEHAVIVGQAKVDQVTKMLQSAAAAADSALGKVVQMNNETTEKRQEMDSELWELSLEEKELREQMQTFECFSPTGQSSLKKQEIEEEAACSVPVKAHQCYDICGASESYMKLIEDMEALREALGCADIQELVNKVVSQQATKEQLLTEINQLEDLIGQETKSLADLERRHTELKFTKKPAATRVDQLKKQVQAQLNLEVKRFEQLQVNLKQSQDLLDTVEQGVSNLYFRMTCMPVEGLPSVSSADSIDKLRDISTRVPTLLQRASMQKPVISDEAQERVYSLLEKSNTLELRNNRRPTTPTDTPELIDDEEEECFPSRDEIKRSSIRLIESQQNKKPSRRVQRKK